MFSYSLKTLTILLFSFCYGCKEAPSGNSENGVEKFVADVKYRSSPFYLFDMEGHSTAAVNLADIDNDGDLDVLTANGRHWAEQDYVFLNNGQGRLLSAIPISQELGASYSILAGDLDGDRDIDLVVIRDRLPIQVFKNDSKGKFTHLTTLSGSGGSARGGQLADFDGDGVLDLVVVKRKRKGFDQLYLGTGDGNFHLGKDIENTQGASTGLSVLDIDGDGDLDMAISRRNDQPSIVLENNGQGQFSVTPIPNSTGDHRKILLADFTGNGTIDILLSSKSGENKLFARNNIGEFKLFSKIGEAERNVQALASADLDGDGDIDFVEGVEELPNMVYFNNGDGSFESVALSDGEEDTYGVAIGDMNGDGIPDLVFANSDAPNFLMLGKRVKK